jgi:hypothetical protein
VVTKTEQWHDSSQVGLRFTGSQFRGSHFAFYPYHYRHFGNRQRTLEVWNAINYNDFKCLASCEWLSVILHQSNSV